MELDWKLLWDVFQGILGLLVFVLVFMLGRVFLKKEAFEEFDKKAFMPIVKRVQTVEETYVSKTHFDDLKDRVGKVENEVRGLPALVQKLNDETIELRTTAKHMNDTMKRIERPIQLIIEAAMKGEKQ